MVRMKNVIGWSQVSRTEVVIKERARGEARAEPEVRNRFRICGLFVRMSVGLLFIARTVYMKLEEKSDARDLHIFLLHRKTGLELV